MKFFALAVLLLTFSVHAPALLDDQQSLLESSSKKMQAGDYEAAEAGFLKVLQSDPKNVNALGNLGIVYTHRQRYAMAIDAYKKALRIAPNEHGILLNLGLVYLKQDDYESARRYFQKLHTLKPKDVQAANLLATCMIYSGEPEPGIVVLKQLLGNNPDNGTLYLMGVAYSRLGRTEVGEKVFAQLFPDAEKKTNMEFLLGQAHYDSLEFALAERDFRDVLTKEPTFAGVHRSLGKNYLSDHRYEEAEKEFRSALTQDPNDASSVYFLGALLVQNGRYAESLPYLERSHETNPDSWSTCFYLGKAQLKMNQLDESIRSLKGAAELNPKESAIFYLLALAYRQAGHAAESRAAFQHVTELHSDALKAQKRALQDQNVVGVR